MDTNNAKPVAKVAQPVAKVAQPVSTLRTFKAADIIGATMNKASKANAWAVPHANVERNVLILSGDGNVLLVGRDNATGSTADKCWPMIIGKVLVVAGWTPDGIVEGPLPLLPAQVARATLAAAKASK